MIYQFNNLIPQLIPLNSCNFLRHYQCMLQNHTQTRITHYTHQFHYRWIHILRKILELLLLQIFYIFTLITQNRCKYFLHRYHLYHTTWFIICWKQFIHIYFVNVYSDRMYNIADVLSYYITFRKNICAFMYGYISGYS